MFFRARRTPSAAPSVLALAPLSRRGALKTILAGGVAAAALTGPTVPAWADSVSFDYGVASGDPLANALVIWTCVTPSVAGRVYVFWAVSTNADMSAPIAGGLARTSSDSDYTVKVDVTGLSPNTMYYYQFSYRGVTSPIGRGRTLPVGSTANIKLATFTCSEFEKGYFNVYADGALQNDLNAILFLGDFIYEYSPGRYTTTALSLGLVTEPRNSLVQPRADIVQLADYRLRYRTYVADKNLQALRQNNASIVVWDDHEFADNANQYGAINHNPATQGPWSERKKRAIQAFYEWQPIREPADGVRYDANGKPAPIYRSFDFGDLARVVMIDTRIIGRDLPYETTTEIASAQLYAVYAAATADGRFPTDLNSDGTARQMMGATQEAWISQQLSTSTQTWQIIGNQNLYSYEVAIDFQNSSVLTAAQKAGLLSFLDQGFGAGSGAQFAALGAAGAPNPAAQDSWTGYPSARQRMSTYLAKAKNPVLVTGDSHNAWGFNVRQITATGIQPLAVEFGTTSVSSPGFEQTIITIPAEQAAALQIDSSTRNSPLDKLIYTDQSRRGYIIYDITPARINATYRFVDTVFSQTYTATTGAVLQVLAGAKTLTKIA